MATAPYGVRLLVGAAVTAVEETLKLPQTILMYPVTVASTVAHIVMKVQQDIAELVTKGDSALEMKAIESVIHLRREEPRRMKSMVPDHVWRLVKPYGLTRDEG